MPILGGGAPVLRAWLKRDALQAQFDVNVGARLEAIVLVTFWLAITVLGGGYQLFLQLQAVARDGAPLSAVTDVLPGIGIMGGVLVLGFWLFRRRARFDTALLLEAFERAIADRSSG